MPDEMFLREKMDALRQYLTDLQRVARHTLDEYLGDLFIKRTGERTIELIVECAVDINNHLCLELGGVPPTDYYQSFLRTADVGVITPDLAARLAPTAGLRNRLAHEYETVADRAVYQAIQRMIPNYTDYLGQVETWLRRAAAGEEESQEAPEPQGEAGPGD